MILADTSIWIDHFRSSDPEMQKQLRAGHIAVHPLVVAELALGPLRDRKKTLAYLEMLHQVKVAQLSEVRRMIEAHSLYSRGIGLTDVHLLASSLIDPSTRLWTADKRLGTVADALGVLHK